MGPGIPSSAWRCLHVCFASISTPKGQEQEEVTEERTGMNLGPSCPLEEGRERRASSVTQETSSSTNLDRNGIRPGSKFLLGYTRLSSRRQLLGWRWGTDRRMDLPVRCTIRMQALIIRMVAIAVTFVQYTFCLHWTTSIFVPICANSTEFRSSRSEKLSHSKSSSCGIMGPSPETYKGSLLIFGFSCWICRGWDAADLVT